MAVIYVALESAGANLDEGDAGAVVGIHVGVNLEHETGEGIFFRIYHALFGLHGTRRRGYLHEAVE